MAAARNGAENNGDGDGGNWRGSAAAGVVEVVGLRVFEDTMCSDFANLIGQIDNQEDNHWWAYFTFFKSQNYY